MLPLAPIAVASVLLLLAAILLAARPRHLLNLAFAGITALYAAVTLTHALARGAPDGASALAHARAAAWASLAFPFFLVLLVRGLVGERRLVDAIVLAAAAATTAAAIAVARDPRILVDHVVAARGGFDVSSGPLTAPLVSVGSACEAAIVVVAARLASSSARSSTERRQAGLVGIAFAVLLLPAGLWFAPFLLLAPASAFDMGLLARSATAILAASLAIVCLPRLARAFQGQARAFALIGASVPALGGLFDGLRLGLAARGLAAAPAGETTVLVWRVAFAVALALALLRWGLAGAGARMRARLATATAFALVAGAGLALAGLVFAIAGRPAWGLVAGALLCAAAATLSPRPVLAAARDLSERILPPRWRDDASLERARAFFAAAEREGPGAKLDVLGDDLGLSIDERRALVAAASERRRPDMLGRYRALRELGRGAAGTAILAEDVTSSALVVVKRFHARSAARAQREADALARAKGPRVLPLLALERVGNETFLVVPYAPGGSAADLLQDGPLAPARAVALARDLLEGLATIHAAGMLHLDVKPENLLLDASGRGIVCDFGASREAPLPDATLTVGADAGTIATLAPEVAAGARPTVAADLFGAGATLFRLLTGDDYADFAGATALDARSRIADAKVRLPHPRVPPALEGILEKALAKDPGDRFASAQEMRDALGRSERIGR